MHEGHRQRMRERFLKEGVEHFQPHELFEMLLFFSVRQGNTNETGHRLIETFGSLSGVMDAPYEELVQVTGIGEVSATLIKLVHGLSTAYYDDKHTSGTLLNSTETVGHYLLQKYFGRTSEAVSLLCMDTSGRFINWVVIHEGSFNAVEVSTRKVLETVIRVGANMVVVAHNHPGGVALPSEADVETTKRLVMAMSIAGVSCVDHIVVAGDDFVSMAESKNYYKIFQT